MYTSQGVCTSSYSWLAGWLVCCHRNLQHVDELIELAPVGEMIPFVEPAILGGKLVFWKCISSSVTGISCIYVPATPPPPPPQH